jgi:hypothetical protein
MRAVILYHPKSDQIGVVEDYSQDFIRFKGRALELVSLETVEGAEMAKLYGVVAYPAVLVIGPDNTLLQMWQYVLPLMDELSAYLGEPEYNSQHQGRLLSPIHQMNPLPLR